MAGTALVIMPSLGNIDSGSGKKTLEHRESRFFEDFEGRYPPFAPPPPPLLRHRSSSSISRSSFDSARQFVHRRMGSLAEKASWHGSRTSLLLSRDDMARTPSQRWTAISPEQIRISVDHVGALDTDAKGDEESAQHTEGKPASRRRSARFAEWARRPWRRSHGTRKGHTDPSNESRRSSSERLS
jgi:hypothetical protein